jgi:O-6-methylguanine DNA methyltransferase
VGLGVDQPQRFFTQLSERFGTKMPQENPAALSEVLTQLREYFAGARRSFDVPLDLRGTAFQKSVWREVARVPYGGTVTYGEIARRIGKPKAARAVGGAVGANPVPIFIPCHRVIGASGALTGYGGGLDVKEDLLRLEGFLPAEKSIREQSG